MNRIYDLEIPKASLEIMQTLKALEPCSYFVGGCVRDSLLKKKPHDWDIATLASPIDVQTYFELNKFDLSLSGLKHGTVGVIHDKTLHEITTFRKESNYSDHRHPDHVEFTDDLREDLSRRDFTINAMAFYLAEDGIRVIDFFGGQKDIKEKIIRCVGNPAVRFQEDGLRILRMLRFAVRLGFSIDEATLEAAYNARKYLRCISRERVKAELDGILFYAERSNLPLFLDQRVMDILAEVIPGIKTLYHFDQNNKYHEFDLWEHTCRVMLATPQDLVLRWAALFHDFGKPGSIVVRDDGCYSYYGHPRFSADIAEPIMEKLRFPKKQISEVLFLVEHHDRYLKPTRKSLMKALVKYGMERTRKLAHLQYADKLAQRDIPNQDIVDPFSVLQDMLSEIEKEGLCYSVRQLAVNGDDLIQLGAKEGKRIAEYLNSLLLVVLSDQKRNTREDLLGIASRWIGG